MPTGAQVVQIERGSVPSGYGAFFHMINFEVETLNYFEKQRYRKTGPPLPPPPYRAMRVGDSVYGRGLQGRSISSPPDQEAWFSGFTITAVNDDGTFNVHYYHRFDRDYEVQWNQSF